MLMTNPEYTNQSILVFQLQPHQMRIRAALSRKRRIIVNQMSITQPYT